MTKQEVFKLIALIESVYPYCTTKNETVSFWFNFCADMDYEKVLARLREHMRKIPYPPSIADISEFTTKNNMLPERVDTIKTVERVWREKERINRKINLLPAWMDEYIPKKSID
jgi:Loader and inhibitor of phage G40P